MVRNRAAAVALNLLLLMVFSGSVYASKPDANWQTAKLISFNQQDVTESGTAQTTGTLNSDGSYSAHTVAQDRDYVDCTVVIDDGKMLYYGQETLRFAWSHTPQFTENETVKYTLKGDHLTVIDDVGKEIKLKLVKRRIKE